MKISLLKISRKKMVINRLELKDLAEMIRKSPEEQKVFNLRLNYQFYQPQRLDDGQIVIDAQGPHGEPAAHTLCRRVREL